MQGKPTGAQFTAAQIHRRLMQDPGYSCGWDDGFKAGVEESLARLATYEAALREIATWHCSGYAITSQLSQEEIIALVRDFYRRADECRDIARKALETP